MLELIIKIKIHKAFHLSFIGKKVVQKIILYIDLLMHDKEGNIILVIKGVIEWITKHIKTK